MRNQRHLDEGLAFSSLHNLNEPSPLHQIHTIVLKRLAFEHVWLGGMSQFLVWRMANTSL
jgi:hypothetical protein